MFAEPPRTQYDLHFRVFGIPVRIHPLFWAIIALLGLNPDSGDMQLWLIHLCCWVAAGFVAILVHELGHALVLSRVFGARPWIVLYGMGGLAIHDRYYRKSAPGTLGEIGISAAGPFAGFLFAALIALVLALFKVQVVFAYIPLGDWVRVPMLYIPFDSFAAALKSLPIPLVDAFYHFLHFILFISVFWGIFNLLPVYPLDGGQIAREIFMSFDMRNGIIHSLWLSVFTAGAIAALALFDWVRSGGRGFPFIPLLFGYLAFQSYQILNFQRWR